MEDARYAMLKRQRRSVSSVKRRFVPDAIGPNWAYARPAGIVDQGKLCNNMLGDVKDCLQSL